MRKTKRVLALCLTIIASLLFMSPKVYACYGTTYDRNEGFCFYHITDRPHERSWRYWERETYTQSLAEEWSKMLGCKVDPEDIKDLGRQNIKDMKDFENHPLLKMALAKKDKEVAEYLRDLALYLNFSNSQKYEYSWNYPSKEQLKEYKANTQKLLQKAKTNKSKRLKKQYRLLRMRLLFNDKQYDKCIELWNAEKATIDTKNVFDNMLTNYYAGALYHTGNKNEAVTVYAQLGDEENVLYCMGNNQNVNYLRDVVKADPNSPLIPYLLDVVMNNANETIIYEKELERHKQNPVGPFYTRSELTGSSNLLYVYNIFGIPQSNRADLMALAEEMSKRSDVKDKCMWLTSMAYLNYLTDDLKNAKTNIDLAMKAEGGKESKNNAHGIRLVIYTKSYDKSKESTIAKDLNIAYEHKKWGLIDEYMYSIAMPVFKEMNDTTMTLLTSYDVTSRPKGHVENYSDHHFYVELLKAGMDMQKKVYKFLYANDNKSELEKAIIKVLGIDRNSFLDVIGTHYLRMGKWEEAKEWLAQVDLEYLKTQNIYKYTHRDYHINSWEINLSDLSDEDSKVNKKLTFCQDVLNTLHAYEHSKGKKHDKIAFELATMYAQASELGYCWWLTRYSTGHDKGEYDLDLPTDFNFEQHAFDLFSEVEKSKDAALALKATFAKVAFAPDSFTHGWFTDRGHNLAYKVVREELRIKNLDLLYNKMKAAPSVPEYISKCDDLSALLKLSGKKI